MPSELNTTEYTIAVVVTELEHFKSRLEKLEEIIEKLYALDKSIDRMEIRVNIVESRLKTFETQVLELRASLNTNFGSMQNYFKDTLEKKLDDAILASTSVTLTKKSHVGVTKDTFDNLLTLGSNVSRVLIIIGVLLAGILGIAIKF